MIPSVVCRLSQPAPRATLKLVAAKTWGVKVSSPCPHAGGRPVDALTRWYVRV